MIIKKTNMEDKTQKQIEKDFLKSAVEKSTIVEIDIQNPTLWQKLTKKYAKKYKVKLVLDDILKISHLAMDLTILDEKFLEDLTNNKAVEFIHENGELLAEILSIVLKEKKSFILKNVGASFMRDLFELMTKLLNFNDFFHSTSLIKNQIAINQEISE